ncbi:papain family cysteine protease, putative [Cryptosporidium muris RN66]|uniref:Papain family cysteine protease, putative n=1 Tax=Cryptosporidium muris (strain RN66) TaxID=441375 RepID=B6AJH9_CRYMR|nr:papain family cysteine protease, putative [Cryptosporidium muris RN66]EEA08370.1 papain family cysteine protease, putative [Cryptosporidium muris RN66]|eukprot:XP_002142719.1 papain family cysteine protease [Cryptosporidium muris RN66]
MEIRDSIEESQGYLSDPYIALLTGTNQQPEPNKKIQKIFLITLLTIVLILVISIYWAVFNSNKHDIDDSDADNSIYPSEQEFKNQFEDFKQKYKKEYSNLTEEKYRYSIFRKNMNFIKMSNNQGFSYVLEMNEYGDLTHEEFMHNFMGYHPQHKNKRFSDSHNILSSNKVENTSPPRFVNWVDAGCVNPVRDQRYCGSCWAFSVVTSLESAVCAQKNEKLVKLSEQQFVDCTRNNGNFGCDGGSLDLAFQYVMEHQYLCTEEEYPYIANEKSCKFSNCKNPIRYILDSYRNVVPNNINALKVAVAKYGPISVAIQADQAPFQFYKKGVFDAPCGTDVNHAVVLVGYDLDIYSGKEYWLVRNSWGENWGENGYIKLAIQAGKKGKGTCGILMEPIYPVLKK